MEAAKSAVVEVLRSLATVEEQAQLLDWIRHQLESTTTLLRDGSEGPPTKTTTTTVAEARRDLAEISEYIKGRSDTPADAVWASERLRFPGVADDDGGGGPDEDGDVLTPDNTTHLDAFLYDEKDEQDLVDAAGDWSLRYHCSRCGLGSGNAILPNNIVSHSFSKRQLELLFTALLPELKASDTLVDVGSRLGAVLYGAHLFSGAGRILGVEMNRDLCRLQSETIRKFGLGDRASVVEAELTTRPDLLRTADVLVLNNVFQWFAGSPGEEATLWRFVGSNVKAGALVVAVPPLPMTFKRLNMDFPVGSWVTQESPRCPEMLNGADDDQGDDEEPEMTLYRVIQPMSL